MFKLIIAAAIFAVLLLGPASASAPQKPDPPARSDCRAEAETKYVGVQSCTESANGTRVIVHNSPVHNDPSQGATFQRGVAAP